MTAAASSGTAHRPDSPCPTRKIRFATMEEAAEHLAQVRAARRAGLVGNGHVECRAHWCDLCAGWHTTSQPSRKGRMSRRGRR